MTAAKTVVVVDDEFYARASLEDLLRKTNPSLIVRPGMDFQAAAGTTEWQDYDQVFLDLAQPLTGRPGDQSFGPDNEHLGCEIVRHIRVACPFDRPAVIVVTSQQASFDSDYVRAWLRVSGADGFIYRHSLAPQLDGILAQGRGFRTEVEVNDDFIATVDGKLLRTDIGGFVDLVRGNNITGLPTGNSGEEERGRLWRRVESTGAPIGEKWKKSATLRLFQRLTRILPRKRYEQ